MPATARAPRQKADRTIYAFLDEVHGLTRLGDDKHIIFRDGSGFFFGACTFLEGPS